MNLRIWLLNGALAGAKILEKMAGRILLCNRFLNILEFQSAPKNGAAVGRIFLMKYIKQIAT